MKKYILFLLAGLSFVGVHAQNNFIACGEQSGIWNYDTVFVQCDVMIPDAATLEIAAGTKVIFEGYYSIHVQGRLRAIGTEADSILFTVTDTTGFGDIHSQAGGWNGIRFEETPLENDSSGFEYCRFSFGKAVGDSVNCYGGAFRLNRFSKLAISHSGLTHNYAFFRGGGLYASKSHIVLKDCYIADNRAGNDSLIYGYGGGIFFVSSNPDVQRNTFVRNTSNGVGGGAAFEYSNPVLLNCVFDDNYSALGGGLGFLRCSPDRSIANLLIINNESTFFGGGVACLTASPRMTNLTITGNSSAMGGGYYCNDYADSQLYNSIIYGNYAYDSIGSQVWIWDVYSEPEFYHCDIQYGTDSFGGSTFHGVYENCIESDPVFSDVADRNFRLKMESPCINSGTPDTAGLMLPAFDFDFHARIIYDQIDMGAFEYDGPVGQSELIVQESLFTIFPNPIAENSVIMVNPYNSEPITFALFDILGKRIPISENDFNGKLIIPIMSLNINKIPSGIYLLKAFCEDRYSVIRMIISEN